MTMQLLTVAFMLLVTLGFFVGLMFLVKNLRRLSPDFAKTIEILGGANISQKGKIVLIESNDTKILLGVTEHHIHKLHVFEKSSFEKEVTHFKQESSCSESA